MLNAADIAAIQRDLAALASDAEQAITYRTYTGTTGGDPVMGIPAQDAYTDEVATATVRELTVEEVQLSAGAYSIGDLEFGVRRNTATNRDLIVYGGSTWRPLEIRRVMLGGQVLRWQLRCKRV